MIAGLPWSAWLLLGAAVGIGLAIALAFRAAHHGRTRGRPTVPLPPHDSHR